MITGMKEPCVFMACQIYKVTFTSLVGSRFNDSSMFISLNIENRIYRKELKESLGMNFFSPFQPEREFKVYKLRKCSQIICSRVH